MRSKDGAWPAGLDRDGGGNPRSWKAVQRFELGVFLFLIVPSLALSFAAIGQRHITFVLTAWATILRDLALVSLIAFFLWRNRESIRVVGWQARHVLQEIEIGIALFVPLLLGTSIVERGFEAAGLSAPAASRPLFLAPHGGGEMALAVGLVAVVAVAEETIFRGYLIRRISSVASSRAIAIVASSAIFALGHGYEGTAGAAAVGVMGFALALVYVWRNSLVAPIVMHLLQDLTAIVLIPWLTHMR
jgi:membrane protease YdiL (CAAX protease family)